MRVLKFDRQAVEALEALGFAIADDQMAARIIKDGVDVTILRPADTEFEFLLKIRLPNEIELSAFTRRRALL